MDRGIRIFVRENKRIVEGLGYYKPGEGNDLREIVKESARRHGNAVGFRFKTREGGITGRTYAEFDRDIDCLGTALLSLGLKGAHISVIGENRYEWGVCYFSIVNGTGVAVPMDKSLPKNEVENLIDRGKVEAIFYSPAYHGMMAEIARTNHRIKYYICMENLGEMGNEDTRFLTMPSLIQEGGKRIDAGERSFLDAPIDREKMSVLLFTSGTTSLSKGVMLSHANIVCNTASISTVLYVGREDVYLSLLPLHHTFENTIGLVLMIRCGACIAYCDGLKYIAQNLREYGVTLLVAVPAIFEAMYRKVLEGVEKSGKMKQFRMVAKLSSLLLALGIDLRRKFFKSIFDQIGPRLRLAVSGAAPIDAEVVVGFNNIGLRLLEGYGLTEASPVVATNNDFVNKPGTIGHPLGGIQVAVDSPDEDGMGEIIVRGGNVMLGYYEDPAATAEAVDADGWLKTGDLGTIDEEGFIRITGRAKSMIVLANGKKAFPEEYEVLLNNIPGVKESFVWGNKAGDGDVEICAKLVVDQDRLAAEAGRPLSEKELASVMDSAIRDINKNIPQYKMIRYFVMSCHELAKTTTLKIKRPVEYGKIEGLLDRTGLSMRKASGKFIDTL
ncbi:MAG: AMP-binding protein [Clostridiales bacterium]|jgi:long-chain acyl-CoA synthetase|nr:AMP-binding protein [Eubacteriales bacterium]MDH7567499.1 AMP-binding protein [Clostridiales bacterium]